MKWDSAADRKLLLAVLDVHKVNIDYESLAARFGNGCTVRAVYNRLYALRKMAEGEQIGPKPISKTTQKGTRSKGFTDEDDDDSKLFNRGRTARTRSGIIKTEGSRNLKEEDMTEVDMKFGIKFEEGTVPWEEDQPGEAVVIDDD